MGKNPHQIAVDHGDPAALMAEFVAISEEVKAVQALLKSELTAALG